MRRLEFWPDYGRPLLWAEDGTSVDLGSLDLPEGLRREVVAWLAGYDDAKLPWEATRDEAWLTEGRRLFAALRIILVASDIELVATEDHWA
jgi:hypothetical protein